VSRHALLSPPVTTRNQGRRAGGDVQPPDRQRPRNYIQTYIHGTIGRRHDAPVPTTRHISFSLETPLPPERPRVVCTASPPNTISSEPPDPSSSPRPALAAAHPGEPAAMPSPRTWMVTWAANPGLAPCVECFALRLFSATTPGVQRPGVQTLVLLVPLAVWGPDALAHVDEAWACVMLSSFHGLSREAKKKRGRHRP